MSANQAENINKSKLTGTRATVYCAFFTALLVALSQISFYIGVIPISLGLLGVLLCGGLLGSRLGVVVILVYVVMGLLGLPVFAGFNSSGAILGPTGGYIAGYFFSAFIASIAGRFVKANHVRKNPAKKPPGKICNRFIMVALLCLAVIACYFFGTVWFSVYTKTTFLAALNVCVLPFLIGDAIKIAISGLLMIRLKRFF